MNLQRKRILFIHQNFPAQFRYVAVDLAKRPDTEVLALTRESNTLPRLVPTLTYHHRQDPDSFGPALSEHYTKRASRGLAVAERLAALNSQGFVPDIVIGHGGWGETLYVRDVWPDARIILHAEFYYAADGLDVNFDPEFAAPGDQRLNLAALVRSRNAAMIQALVDADLGIAPTQFQASTFPPILRSKLHVVHEGIDTDAIRPNPQTCVTLTSTRLDRPLSLRAGDEILTFVSRHLEPYRGFHVFMRALPEILRHRPEAQVVIIGDDLPGYGLLPANGLTWKETLIREIGARLDLDRIHFAGRLTYQNYIAMLQISRLHVYATYPFVLSWSMLEAMSAGALVLASDTAPVREVIVDGVNGIMFPFFDADSLTRHAIEALSRPDRFDGLRFAAREHIKKNYDTRRVCTPDWLKIVDGAAAIN